MAQTYCVQTDVEDIWSVFGVDARTDDDEDGTPDDTKVTSAIERAATKMNARLDMRYTLSDLASNDWCKWCNATLAAVELAQRRGLPIPHDMGVEAQNYKDDLLAIYEGRLTVPEANDSLEMRPTVTNYAVEPWRGHMPVRRKDSTSTGARPPSGLKSHTAYEPTED